MSSYNILLHRADLSFSAAHDQTVIKRGNNNDDDSNHLTPLENKHFLHILYPDAWDATCLFPSCWLPRKHFFGQSPGWSWGESTLRRGDPPMCAGKGKPKNKAKQGWKRDLRWRRPILVLLLSVSLDKKAWKDQPLQNSSWSSEAELVGTAD